MSAFISIVLFFIHFLLADIPEVVNYDESVQDGECLNEEEQELYRIIMDYRSDKKLKKITLSKSLSTVAFLHAKDLHENHTYGASECNMHSWSDKGAWIECCYTDDHKNPECMWNKPKEITEYKGAGYEISYFNSRGVTALEALKGWQSSKPHNEMIINKSIWKQVEWDAIGIGIYGNFSTVWFGRQTDPEKPEVCN